MQIGDGMDRMTSMATFVKVVESEGFSAAARALGISPSMATTHVRSLEERLGVRLLNRSTRRVSLTEAGHVTMSAACRFSRKSRMPNAWRRLCSRHRGAHCASTRQWRFPPFLAPVIAEFVALYPTCRST